MKKSGKRPQHSRPASEPHAARLAQALGAHQQGRLEVAEPLYRAILQAQPAHFHALHYCGVLCMQSGRLAEGVSLIEEALRHGEAPDALSNLSGGLLQLRRYADALPRLERAARLDPQQAAVHTNLGVALAGLGRHAEAVDAYRKALQLQPVFPEALNNLGNALRALDRPQEALAALDQALVQRPGYPEALNNRGLALSALRDFKGALTSYDQALAQRPRYAEAHNNRGNALKDLYRFDEAQAAYDAALALDPDYAEARYNRGNNFAAQGRHQDALLDFALALQLQPDNPDIHWNSAISQLLLGNFTAGFAGYEWRWRIKQADARREFDCPEWDGQQDLAGKHVIVWAEQGLGDTLQFCLLATRLAARGARVSMEVQAPLRRLLARLPDINVFARGDAPPAADFHCPLLSLPLRLALRPADLPITATMLAASADERQHWAARLPPAPLRIAICCSGNPKLANDRNRSIPLARFLTLHAPARQLVLMQKDLRNTDEAALTTHADGAPVIHDLRDELNDFCDTAAALSQCDLLVTVDTSVAHLAGALGVPVWILLPHAPDWRWQTDREDSPWYPSARLFRQRKPEDWLDVFTRVRTALAALPAPTR